MAALGPVVRSSGIFYANRLLRREPGRAASKGKRKSVPAQEAVISMENGWFAGDEMVMGEELRIEVHPVSGGSRSIDIKLTWTPARLPVKLRGAEDKSYGGLTFRFGSRSRTLITTPTGLTNDDW